MIAEPNCSLRNCRHLTGATNTKDERGQRPACHAFPDGIPDDIAYGDNPHTSIDDRQPPGNRFVFEVR